MFVFSLKERDACESLSFDVWRTSLEDVWGQESIKEWAEEEAETESNLKQYWAETPNIA